MDPEEKLPSLAGEELYIPFVGAIIQRDIAGKRHVLVQTRDKESDKLYSGSLEIPGGKFRAFEDIYEALRREVREECGLEITFIHGEDHRVDYHNGTEISSLIEPFSVIQVRQGPFFGVVFLCQATGEPVKRTNETINIRWLPIDELKRIVDQTPEKVYPAFLAPLKKYLIGV